MRAGLRYLWAPRALTYSAHYNATRSSKRQVDTWSLEEISAGVPRDDGVGHETAAAAAVDRRRG